MQETYVVDSKHFHSYLPCSLTLHPQGTLLSTFIHLPPPPETGTQYASYRNNTGQTNLSDTSNC
jgi:hypothetical protein